MGSSAALSSVGASDARTSPFQKRSESYLGISSKQHASSFGRKLCRLLSLEERTELTDVDVAPSFGGLSPNQTKVSSGRKRSPEWVSTVTSAF